MRNDEDEESLDGRVSQGKNESRESPQVERNKNMKILDMRFTEFGVEGRGVGGQRRIELCEEQERNDDSDYYL